MLRSVKNLASLLLTVLLVGIMFPSTAYNQEDRSKTVYLPITAMNANVGIPSATGVPPASGPRWQYLTNTNLITDIAIDEAARRVWAVGRFGAVAWDMDSGTSTFYSIADGLPSHWLSSVLVTRSGETWVGARGAGAAHLGEDGRWHADPVTNDGPADVLTIVEDDEGGLWFGTLYGAHRRAPDGNWSHDTRETGGPGGAVLSIAEDREGKTWFGLYFGGLSVLHPDGSWEQLRVGQDADGGLDDTVFDLEVDPQGQLWVVSARYVDHSARPRVSIRSGDGRWSEFDVEGWVENAAIRAVAFDAAGQPFFAADNGLFVPRADSSWHRLGVAEGLAGDFATSLSFDRDGNLWAAALGGLSRLGSDGALQMLRRGGLRGQSLHGLAFDEKGNTFIAAEGLATIDASGSWSYLTTEDGLIQKTVKALAYDADAGLWFATSLDGYRDDKDVGGVHHLSQDGELNHYSRADGLHSAQVTDIAIDAERTAFFASKSYCYAPKQCREGGLTIRTADGSWSFLPRGSGPPGGGDIEALLVDADQSLWVGSRAIAGGSGEVLTRRHPNGLWATVSLPPSAGRVNIADLAIGPNGSLWVGTLRGVFVRDVKGQWTTPLEEPALAFAAISIASDAQGALWFLSPEGVHILHADGRWESMTTDDGLTDEVLSDIAVAPDGTIWFSDNAGTISILDRR